LADFPLQNLPQNYEFVKINLATAERVIPNREHRPPKLSRMTRRSVTSSSDF